METGENDEASPASRTPFGDLLTTSTAAERQAVDVWREHVRSTCGDVRVAADRESFRQGTIRTGKIAAAGISSIKADPHSVVRTSCHDPQGYVYFCHLLTGTARLTQDGRESVTRTGDIVCFDSRRPFSLTMPETFAMVTLRVPHSQMRLRIADTTGVTARPWSGRSGVPAVVGNALAGLDRHLGDLAPDVADSLGSGFISMVGQLLAERLDRTADDSELARRTLLDRVMRFGRQYLSDPDLSPQTLASAHHVSVRYLQQLFAMEGTSPARWIREERLARCYSDLCDPAQSGMTVGAISERWGLPNASHFSRQFRDQYGTTPRGLRDRIQPVAA